MAKFKKASKTVLNWKKKKWFEVNAPDFFNNKELGKTITSDNELLIGRKLSSNLMMLTRDPKKQNIIIDFEIVKTTGQKCDTRVCRYEIMSNSMRKYVRREKTKIDDSFLVESKDNIKVRIKPLIVTQYLASKAIQCELRKSVKQWIEKKINESTYNETIKNIILGKFQKEMKDSIKKITSVKTSEIRIIKIEEGKKQFKFEENLDKTKVEA